MSSEARVGKRVKITLTPNDKLMNDLPIRYGVLLTPAIGGAVLVDFEESNDRPALRSWVALRDYDVNEVSS